MTLAEKICQFLIEIFNALFSELELGLEPFIKMIFQNRTTVEEKVKKVFKYFFAAPKAAA